MLIKYRNKNIILMLKNRITVPIKYEQTANSLITKDSKIFKTSGNKKFILKESV